MKIAVLVKQVPQNAQAVLREDGSVDRAASVKGMNPADRCAILHAVALAGEEDTVTALSMGPASAEDTLREAIGLGAKEGILLTDPAFAGSDTLATARVLAAAVKKLDADLVLCGRRTIDGETAQVGPQLAVRLGIPCVANVTKLRMAEGTVEAERLTAGGRETVLAALPAVVTVTETLDVMALPSLAGLRTAARALIRRWDLADLELDAADCGLSGSATRVVKSYFVQVGLRHPKRLLTPGEGARAILAGLERRA